DWFGPRGPVAIGVRRPRPAGVAGRERPPGRARAARRPGRRVCDPGPPAGAAVLPLLSLPKEEEGRPRPGTFHLDRPRTPVHPPLGGRDREAGKRRDAS